MNLKLILSDDGSHTLYREDLDEHYHSTHGAIQESLHVFIEKGLKEISKTRQNVSVLEVGFGTGLNALLTCLNSKCNINYTGIEAYPIKDKIIENLNYTSILENTIASNVFEKIHNTSWDGFYKISDSFSLKKIKGEVQKIDIENGYDLVYYDAFGPAVQCEMWDRAIFQKIFKAMNIGGIFVTYCAKGQVRRDLQNAGFIVERLEGPPGKREMLRARKE